MLDWLSRSDDTAEEDVIELHTPDDRDIETLRATREEARTVLDHQIQLLSDIDDKAMRTVRITLLTLGIFLSAATFPGATQFVNYLTVAGAGLMLFSIVFGLVTYSASTPDFGVETGHLDEIREFPYHEDEWLETLLHGYGEWIESMDQLNRGNELFLSITQVCLGLGILLLALGVFFGFTGTVEPIQPADPLANATT